MIAGCCLCGANAFALDAPPGPVTACHCGQCRRYTGHHAASIDVDAGKLRWLKTGNQQTFRHPSGARRVFCGTCGSKLWFAYADGALSLEAGILHCPTGPRLARHIHVADKGDFYELADGLPQVEQF